MAFWVSLILWFYLQNIYSVCFFILQGRRRIYFLLIEIKHFKHLRLSFFQVQIDPFLFFNLILLSTFILTSSPNKHVFKMIRQIWRESINNYKMIDCWNDWLTFLMKTAEKLFNPGLCRIFQKNLSQQKLLFLRKNCRFKKTNVSWK